MLRWPVERLPWVAKKTTFSSFETSVVTLAYQKKREQFRLREKDPLWFPFMDCCMGLFLCLLRKSIPFPTKHQHSLASEAAKAASEHCNLTVFEMLSWCTKWWGQYLLSTFLGPSARPSFIFIIFDVEGYISDRLSPWFTAPNAHEGRFLYSVLYTKQDDLRRSCSETEDTKKCFGSKQVSVPEHWASETF